MHVVARVDCETNIGEKCAKTERGRLDLGLQGVPGFQSLHTVVASAGDIVVVCKGGVSVSVKKPLE